MPMLVVLCWLASVLTGEVSAEQAVLQLMLEKQRQN